MHGQFIMERRDQSATGGISGFWIATAASGEAALNAETSIRPLSKGELMIARVMESGPVRKGREDLEDLVEQTVNELPGVPQEVLMRRLEEKHAEKRATKPGHGHGQDLFRMRCADALRSLRNAGRVARGPLGEPPRWWPVQEGGMDA